jgi:adenylate kinase family enzyme
MVKRLQVFREQTGPVIAHFDKAGKVVRVNTSYSPAEVYEGVAKAVTPIVEAEVRRL